ncbi:MAG: glycosyltransferase family 2 protein [Lachnospiraceae bacterium]|nr:glycosyltransferase family 2 protein [Lachnospiraceae bacterium]
MMDKVLTISVAAYNVEDFLEKTLDSCVAIDKDVLDKVEIIIVDDGSVDGTQGIGERYEDKYKLSVKYVRKENGGHGSTINYSMQHAQGKYFMLLDGDDWVDTASFRELVMRLQEEEADVISCSYNMVDNETGKETLVSHNSMFEVNKQYQAKKMLSRARIFLAGLIVKTSILQRYPFHVQEKCFYVDMEYVTFFVPYVKTVIFYDLTVYQCRTALVNQSTSKLGAVQHADDHIQVAKNLIDFYEVQKASNLSVENMKYIQNMCIKVIEDVFLLPFSFPINDKEIRDKMLKFNDYLYLRDKELYRKKFRKKVNIMRKSRYIGWQLFAVINSIRYR